MACVRSCTALEGTVKTLYLEAGGAAHWNSTCFLIQKAKKTLKDVKLRHSVIRLIVMPLLNRKTSKFNIAVL